MNEPKQELELQVTLPSVSIISNRRQLYIFSPIKCKGLICLFFQAAFDKTVRKFSGVGGEGGETNGGEGGQLLPFRRCQDFDTFLKMHSHLFRVQSGMVRAIFQQLLLTLVSTELCFFSVARWRWCPWKLSTFLTTHQPLPLPHRLHQSHPQTRPTSKGFWQKAFVKHLYHIHSQLKSRGGAGNQILGEPEMYKIIDDPMSGKHYPLPFLPFLQGP